VSSLRRPASPKLTETRGSSRARSAHVASIRPAGVVGVGAGHHAEELVASPADDRVIGAQSHPEAGVDTPQRTVACGVADRVVGPLQVVDVDERDLQPFAVPPRPFDLATDQHLADPAPESAGQVVELGTLELRQQVRPIERRRFAVARRVPAVDGRPRPRRPGFLAGHGSGGEGGLGARVEIVELARHGRRLTVGKGGRDVPRLGGLVAAAAVLVAQDGLGVALRRDPGPRRTRRRPRQRPCAALRLSLLVGAQSGGVGGGVGAEIEVGSLLVAVGERLVGLRGGLIPVRSGLVGVGGGLVEVG